MGDKYRTHFKVMATFKCSRENCNGRWDSAHGWTLDKMVACKNCGRKPVVLQIMDEMTPWGIYRCPSEACIKFWRGVHKEKLTAEKCKICETMVIPEEFQDGLARHVFYGCQNESCEKKPKWDEFLNEIPKYQLCSKKVDKAPDGAVIPCRNVGHIICAKKSKPRPHWLRKRLMNKQDCNDGTERHKVDFCEVCQDIRELNLAGTSNCMSKTKVVYKREKNMDGTKTERIVKME